MSEETTEQNSILVSEKCAICLQELTQSKSFASQCFHSFCFECIMQWSAIKLSCPLCKKTFDRILFNVKSNLQYKQFSLRPIVQQQPLIPEQEIIEYQPNDEHKNNNYSKASWLVCREQAPVEFRILVYLNKWYSCPKQQSHHLKIKNLWEEFTSATNNDSIRSSNTKEILCEIQNNLSSDLLYLISYRPVKQFRETSPEFYSKNIALTHRLIQFIYRELKAIACVMSKSKLPNLSKIQYLDQATRSTLIQLIITELKRNTIQSDEFLKFISEYLSPLELAKQFLHELNSFCLSTSSSLIDYDSKCVYFSSEEAANQQLDSSSISNFPLPVNLCKYRLFEKPLSLAGLEQGRFGNDQEQEPIIITNDNEQEGEDSSNSSFCEYLIPSPKQSPQYIVLNSSEDDENQNESSSFREKNEKACCSTHLALKSSSHKSRKTRSRSKSESRSRHHKKKSSNNESRRRSKKKKKHKKKQKD